ncbi:hypothetical protein BZG02_15330 [Labilibaculum filiforme]|uniref:Ribosomal protein L7/L12 C-terminal domain-containing protein n=1 Tax=Labilibaculum filiforme TaxID=1940526 RepID=A0A2N3HU23_9BACT|nr:hypothetical protein [Labilibaculum filiforme]PKQ61560.1 hypothetical protein BZG02_15330 [Labilibaculum filiforme]
MNIIINGFQIDKAYLLQLLADDQKLLAIKILKETTDLSLQDSKAVIDQLQDDPNYYDGEEHIIGYSADESWEEAEETEKPIASSPTTSARKSHYLKDDNKSSNVYIILFILICIAGSIYFYLNK